MDIPQPWVLSTDRTEWSFGATRFNILMLGIVHNGVPYPLVWEMLDKKGNSNSSERMDLMDRFSQTPYLVLFIQFNIFYFAIIRAENYTPQLKN